MIRMIVFASLVTVNGAWAAAPPSPASAEVRRWIEQLGHRDYSVRDNAQRRLEARGPAVRNALRLREWTADLEMRLRIERLLKKCEPAYDLLPRRVNARFVRTPLAEVIRQIAWQTDLPTVLSDGPLRGSPHFTGTFDNTPYWEALDTVARQCQLRVDLRAGTREEFAVILKPGVPQRHVHYWNSLRVVVQQVGTQSLRDPADEPSSGHPLVGVKHWVFAEPGRLGMDAFNQEPGHAEASAPSKRNFTYLDQFGIDCYFVPMDVRDRILSMESQLTSETDSLEKHEVRSFVAKKYVLIPPKGKNRRIETLTGSFPLWITRTEEIVRIPIARKTVFVIDGITYTSHSCYNKYGKSSDVFCKPPINSRYNIRFLDDNQIICNYATSNISEGRVAYYVFPSQFHDQPAKEMRVSHRRSQRVEVPFEFRDIPLP